MQIPKKFLHDRIILLLISSTAFLTVLNALLILLRLDSSRGSYIVQYRANLGLGAYKAGTESTFIYFVILGFIILSLQIVLGARAYKIHKQWSIAIATLCLLTVVVAMIVSNALLSLR